MEILQNQSSEVKDKNRKWSEKYRMITEGEIAKDKTVKKTKKKKN